MGLGANQLERENSKRLQELLKRPIKRDYEQSYERKVKTLAQQCLNAPKDKSKIEEQVKYWYNGQSHATQLRHSANEHAI